MYQTLWIIACIIYGALALIALNHILKKRDWKRLYSPIGIFLFILVYLITKDYRYLLFIVIIPISTLVMTLIKNLKQRNQSSNETQKATQNNKNRWKSYHL
jgi:predicted PurR-regulated permease PerM